MLKESQLLCGDSYLFKYPHIDAITHSFGPRLKNKEKCALAGDMFNYRGKRCYKGNSGYTPDAVDKIFLCYSA
jgi:hypothetical protein